MAPLTYREELKSIRARLKELDREFSDHTGWLKVAAMELGDALKEIPRAELARRLPDAPSALAERKPPARADFAPIIEKYFGQADGGGAAVEPAVSVPGPETLKAGLEPARGAAPAASEGERRGRSPEPAGTPTGPAVPPASGKRRVNPCSRCGETGHRMDNKTFHPPGGAQASPATAPASDDEEPEPARAARSRDIVPVLEALRPWADQLPPSHRRIYDLRVGGALPAVIAETLDLLSHDVSARLFHLRRRLEILRDRAGAGPVRITSLDLGPSVNRNGLCQPRPGLSTKPTPHAVRHYLEAPDSGDGLARCGALGESICVIAKLSMVSCPECLRLMGARCTRCGELGHVMRRCPLKGDSGKATLLAYRAEVAAKRAAVVEAPLEVNDAPASPAADILPLSAPSPMVEKEEESTAATFSQTGPGRGRGVRHCKRCGQTGHSRATCDVDLTEARVQDIALAAARLGIGPALAVRAPMPVKHEGSVCEKAQVARWDREDLDGWHEEFYAGEPEPLIEPPRKLGPAVGGWDRELVFCGACQQRGHTRTECGREPGDAPPPVLITPPRPLSLVEGEADPTPMQARLRAKLRVVDGRVRAKTVPSHGIAGHLRRDEREVSEDEDLLDPSSYDRPAMRADCSDQSRPCPWASCSHHLALDVNDNTGAIKMNFPHLEIWEMTETCSLDVADRGGITLEEVGAILNLTRERIRQVEVRGLAKIKDHSGDELGLPPDRD